jgi:cytoskeleton protein RodZ
VNILNTTQAEASGRKAEAKKLGAFLRSEREKMKLSQDQIAQRMRLRPFVIEAIENEAWDRLPPPVFVRGFLRSYARTLEIDEKKTLELYRLNAPPEEDALKPVAVARPSHRGRALFIIGVVVVIVCISYYWYVNSSVRNRGATVALKSTAPTQIGEIVPQADSKPLNRAGVSPKQEWAPLEAVATAPAVEETSPTPAPGPPPESLSPWLTLKGEVKETTWVSIRVDGSEPKEYMFQPGARPQWQGRRGFEIIIGNAGGMSLDLDGKSMETLGRPGQVIRLRLP